MFQIFLSRALRHVQFSTNSFYSFLSRSLALSPSHCSMYMFLEIIWQQSFKGTHADVLRKTVKLSPSVRAGSTMKSCPSISVDSSAPSSGTQGATDELRHANCNCCSCDRVQRIHCKRQKLHARSGTHMTRSCRPWPTRRNVFSLVLMLAPSSSARPCDILLTSQLSFACSVLIRQCTQLLMQCSQRIFHFWDVRLVTLSRVGSHDGAKGFKSQTVRDLRVRANELHARPKNRVSRHAQLTSRPNQPTSSHSFRQQPISSTRPKIRQRAHHSFSKQGTDKTQDSTAHRCHVCRVFALCPARKV